ncbi:hypothetical protein L9F63_027880, partial [Diploptera punctata]
ESPIHRALFWVGVSVLQLDEVSLYASGLALLEQNLHTLDSQGSFEEKSTSGDICAQGKLYEFIKLWSNISYAFSSSTYLHEVGRVHEGIAFRGPQEIESCIL